MQRLAILVCTLLIALGGARAAERHVAKGLVIKVDRDHQNLLVSCQSIPGYMEAMVMPFTVRDSKELDGLAPGDLIDFTLVVDQETSHVEGIRVHGFESLEQDPLAARRLGMLDKILDPASAANVVQCGQRVPDFTLIDQSRQRVTLSQFSGKVVAMSFIYTRCPLPNYCFRLSNNFRLLQKRFASQMGRDLVLLSLSFDPAHDQPEVFAKYSSTWEADLRSWHFLTGPPDDVHKICIEFGMDFWPDEGLMTHSLHTVVIDRQGKMAANLEGNEYTAEQLGDLVQSVLEPKTPGRQGVIATPAGKVPVE